MSTSNVVYAGVLAGEGITDTVTTVSYKPRQGGSTNIVFKGTPNGVLNKYNELRFFGWEVTINNGEGAWTLTATLNRDIISDPNTDPTPQDQWSLSGNAGQQSLLECIDRPTIALLTTPGKEAIESQIKNPLNQATANYRGANQSSVVSVYNLMRLGVEGRPTFFPTLKRTITVSNNYRSNWIINNVGKVLTTNTLISYYNVTNDVSSLLPSSSGLTTDTNGVSTFGGWLEHYPTVDFAGYNKKQISQEWQFNTRWSSIMYDQI